MKAKTKVWNGRIADPQMVNKDGLIDKGNWCHISLVPFLRLMPAAMADKSIKTFLQSHQVQMDLPIMSMGIPL